MNIDELKRELRALVARDLKAGFDALGNQLTIKTKDSRDYLMLVAKFHNTKKAILPEDQLQRSYLQLSDSLFDFIEELKAEDFEEFHLKEQNPEPQPTVTPISNVTPDDKAPDPDRNLKISILYNFWTLLERAFSEYPLLNNRRFFPQNMHYEIEKRIDKRARQHQRLFGISIVVGMLRDEPVVIRIQTSFDPITDMGIMVRNPDNGDEISESFPLNGTRDKTPYLALYKALQKLEGETWEDYFFWQWIAWRKVPEFNFTHITNAHIHDLSHPKTVPDSVAQLARAINALAEKIQGMECEGFEPIAV